MGKSKHIKNSKYISILKWVAYILFIACIATMSGFLFLYCISPELRGNILKELSQNFGDFITGTVGISLSFISTFLLVLTFKSQQKQFELSQDEAYRTRFEGTFFNILSTLYSVRDEVNKQIKTLSKLQSHNLSDFYFRMRVYYDECLSQDKDFSISMGAFSEQDLVKTQYDTAVKELGQFYDNYVKEQGYNAGFYFRFIHNLVAFVINHWKYNKDDIKLYLNFIQAQLSDEELSLIFYDCISSQGKDKKKQYTFKYNLDKYGFLENIPCNALLDRKHYKIFYHTTFRFLNEDERKKVLT